MREVYERRPAPDEWTRPAGAQDLLDAQAGVVAAPETGRPPPPAR
jgi:hypothetical protein